MVRSLAQQVAAMGADIETRCVEVAGAELEVSDFGRGEPIVLIQTALLADHLQHVATQPVLQAYRKIVYHRRGYAGSSPAEPAGSIERDAADCRALLEGWRSTASMWSGCRSLARSV